MNLFNLILNTDGYKPTHWLQYMPKTEYQFSYIQSRGGFYDRSVMFGLQIFNKEYLSKPITQEDIDEADEFFEDYYGNKTYFNRAGWQYILEKYNGYLPVKITAIPEGTIIPTGNILVAVENLDPLCFWLTSYIETILLRAVWYGTTVCTNSFAMKEIILEYLVKTGTPESIAFKLHDFGARGVSSFESAGIAGAAHLVNFRGTDTLTGILYVKKYYNKKNGKRYMPGNSIAAAEHSTTTSWGGRDGEVKSFENMIDQFAKPGAMYAVVSDAYDIYHAIIAHWGTTLKQKVERSGAVLVVRPDSGDPVEVTLRCVELLGEKFGFSINSKGYKVLKPCVRLIQGDGIDREMVRKILANFAKHGWSADNIGFGSGGGLLQKVDRDSLKFAMKCSAICVDGVWSDVFKDPITDPGKSSKKGILQLVRDMDGTYSTVRVTADELRMPVLEEVFNTGKVIKEQDFEEIRALAA